MAHAGATAAHVATKNDLSHAEHHTSLSQVKALMTPLKRKRRYLGRYFAHPMMQNRRAKRDDYKPSAVRVTQRYVP
ncbi:hypothetical protein ACGP04_14775 [Piscirickettsia salmonis]|uniref:hypothetical protein n=1 Tax=Piscirickettsia salmonis TaxID=1238 RepID=UPI0037511116